MVDGTRCGSLEVKQSGGNSLYLEVWWLLPKWNSENSSFSRMSKEEARYPSSVYLGTPSEPISLSLRIATVDPLHENLVIILGERWSLNTIRKSTRSRSPGATVSCSRGSNSRTRCGQGGQEERRGLPMGRRWKLRGYQIPGEHLKPLKTTVATHTAFQS